MDWEAWSRAGWQRHAPDVDDLDAFVEALGDATIHGLSHRLAREKPDAPAVTVGDASLTFGEIDGMAARAAANFAPGMRVLIAAPVSPLWIGAYLGVLRAGAAAVLVNPAYTQAERDELARTARADVTLSELDDGLFAAPPAPPSERSRPDSIALVAFTSGTTGRPKAVPLTHRSLLTSVRAAMAAWRWSGGDVLVHGLPLFHLHGLNGLHATLIAGSRLHLLGHLTPEALARALDLSGASVLFAVPTMYGRLVGHEPMPNRLRLCISGSAPLGGDAAQTALRVLGHLPLVRYGLTETGLDTSQVYGDARAARTVGVPLPGARVRLAEDGEIQVRGPQVFSGYEPAGEGGFTADGWFRTGDVGALDEATGDLTIVGRTKEIIITGGLKVHPREVEVVLELHATVAEAAVAGVASERWGEEVTAWVVLKPGAAFEPDALIRHARAHLAPHKAPKTVHQARELPRNPVGKIDRKRLSAG